MLEPQQPGARPDMPPAPRVVSVPVRFVDPLTDELHEVITALAVHLLGHVYEVHDYRPEGESITRLKVHDYISAIEPVFDGSDPHLVTMRFAVSSKDSKEILVWTSSLLFQCFHYNVARLAEINGRPHTLDWEAQQDPKAPWRVKESVEEGKSLIERLARSNR